MNTERLCKYFFYGLKNQERIIRELINRVAVLQKDSLFKEELEMINENVKKKFEENKLEFSEIRRKIEEINKRIEELKDEDEIKKEKSKIYKLQILLHEKEYHIRRYIEKKPILLEKQIEEAAGLLLQLRRFVTANDNPKNKQYIFNDEEEMKKTREEIREYIKNNLKESGKYMFYISYAPCSGVFYKGKKEIPEPWVQEVIDELKELQELQKDNIFQYYSTYMDVKYARAINRMQENSTQDYEEKDAIRDVYRTFLKR